MASRQSTVDLIVEQMSRAGAVSARKMFGEFAVYCDGKLVALVCDDQLFVKPTPAGRTLLGDCVQSPPYEGAKPCFLIGGERWEDGDWMAELVRVTAADLPMPKKKPRAKSASASSALSSRSPRN